MREHKLELISFLIRMAKSPHPHPLFEWARIDFSLSGQFLQINNDMVFF